EAMREGTAAAADTARRAGGAAERGTEATVGAGRRAVGGTEVAADTAGEAARDAAAGQARSVQGAAGEAEKAGRELAGLAEQAAAGMRSLAAGPAGALPSPANFQEAQQAVSRLVQAVMETNMRFADEMLRRTGPSAVVELQRRFVREYFEALARGGTMLLQAARQAAAEQPPRQPEPKAARHGGDGKVADVMSRDVALASPDDTVQQAARLMRERDTGALPVGEGDRLVGMVTDRDIALRVAAAGMDPSRTKLREVMSGEPHYVFADETIESAAASMAVQQVQRVPVLNRDRRLVGILSLGDLAREAGGAIAGEALEGVSRPGGRRNQGPDAG
ncbi:CBS domain-containing protein, partial [Craurococcus roseus]